MKNILIFFDSDFLCLIIQKMITDMGLNAFIVQDKKGFSQKLSDEKIDAVLTDTSYRGKENPFLDELKKRKIPFLIISENENPQDIKAALKKGAEEYIMKPFDHDILQSKLSMMGIC